MGLLEEHLNGKTSHRPRRKKASQVGQTENRSRKNAAQKKMKVEITPQGVRLRFL